MMIKAGQLLAVTKPNGLFVIYTKSVAGKFPNNVAKFLHEDKIYSKYVPIGEIFLCLEATYHDCEDVYGLKILWKDETYYVFCSTGEVRAIGE